MGVEFYAKGDTEPSGVQYRDEEGEECGFGVTVSLISSEFRFQTKKLKTFSSSMNFFKVKFFYVLFFFCISFTFTTESTFLTSKKAI
jgi:hypothetical protein